MSCRKVLHRYLSVISVLTEIAELINLTLWNTNVTEHVDVLSTMQMEKIVSSYLLTLRHENIKEVPFTLAPDK